MRESLQGHGVSSGFWVCSSLVTVGRARRPGVRSSLRPRGDWEAWRGRGQGGSCPCPRLSVGSNVKKTDKPAWGVEGLTLVPVSWFSEAGVLLSLMSQRGVLVGFACRRVLCLRLS